MKQLAINVVIDNTDHNVSVFNEKGLSPQEIDMVKYYMTHVLTTAAEDDQKSDMANNVSPIDGPVDKTEELNTQSIWKG